MNASPIDLQFLVEASDGDHAEMMDLVHTARTDMRQQLAALTQALLGGDLLVIKNAAHKVKGSSAMIGAHALKAVCLQIEMAAKAGTRDPLAGFEVQCDSEARRVLDALDACR